MTNTITLRTLPVAAAHKKIELRTIKNTTHVNATTVMIHICVNALCKCYDNKEASEGVKFG